MAGINFMGSYSGIDGSAIDDLMKAEKAPLVQYANKKTSLKETQDAWKDINTRLNSLFEKIKNLGSSDTFKSKVSTSTNEDIVSITPSKNSIVGKYNINVEQIATNTSIVGSEQVKEKFVQDGSFTIKNKDENSKSVTIDIKEGETLKDVVNKINKTTKDKSIEYKVGDKKVYGTGISATIIDNRIILTDENTGNRSIKLENVTTGEGSFDSNVLGKLGLKSSDDTNEGKDAIFTINGIEVTRTTNSVDDVIENATINLKKAHTDTTTTEAVNVTMDSEKTTKAVQDFVDQYNSTIQFIEDKMKAGDPEVPGSKGTLSGDSSLMRLHSSLRQMVTSTVDKDSNIKDISKLGVETIDKWGKLKFDSSKLQEQLKENPEDVVNFFSGKDGKDTGFIDRINTYIDGFISKSGGIIKTKTESYDKSLKDLNRRIEDFEDRMERKEKYYIKMFSALDVAMMQAESQMSWLQGQVDSMNAGKK
jgi:flagellar hook-associated protein 2